MIKCLPLQLDAAVDLVRLSRPANAHHISAQAAKPVLERNVIMVSLACQLGAVIPYSPAGPTSRHVLIA